MKKENIFLAVIFVIIIAIVVLSSVLSKRKMPTPVEIIYPVVEDEFRIVPDNDGKGA